MKKTALLAAVAAFSAAAPAAAQGYLGLEYSSSDNGSDKYDVWQGEGAFGFGGDNWGSQINASVGQLGGDSEADIWTLGGHLWWQGDGWRLGAVAATTRLDFSGTKNYETQYGVEGTWDVTPNAVLFSSYTIGDITTGGSADATDWDLGVNFYAGDNLRIGGVVGFGSFDFGGPGNDFDTTSLGINGEFQPWTAPVSVTLALNRYELQSDNVDAFRIGARWNFGGGTLRERDNATPFDTHTGLIDRSYGIW